MANAGKPPTGARGPTMNIGDLPEVLVERIFEHVKRADYDTLANLPCVCRRWRDIFQASCSNDTWKVLHLKFNASQKQRLPAIARYVSSRAGEGGGALCVQKCNFLSPFYGRFSPPQVLSKASC